jgi:hypothetical protein
MTRRILPLLFIVAITSAVGTPVAAADFEMKTLNP